MARKIRIGIALGELADYLRGRRRLTLPEDAECVSIAWGQVEAEDGSLCEVRWLSFESSKFPEVTFRIPHFLAADWERQVRSLMKKPALGAIRAARAAQRRIG